MWSAGISGCTIEPEPFVFPTRTFAAVVLGLVYFLPDFSHQLCLSVAVFALGLVSLPLFPPLADPCCQWSVVSAGLSLEDCVCILKLFQPLCVSGFLSVSLPGSCALCSIHLHYKVWLQAIHAGLFS